MGKFTYDDLADLLNEIENGANKKNRTLDDVHNSNVRNLLIKESEIAIKSGISASVVAGSLISGTSLLSSLGGAGIGAFSSGLSSLGVASFSAVGGAAVGGTAGSAVPVVGTIIGAAAGLIIGKFIGGRVEKKKAQNTASLLQETVKKQNRIIKDLQKEVDELKEKYGKTVEQNKRYKYILSLLMANEEVMKWYSEHNPA